MISLLAKRGNMKRGRGHRGEEGTWGGVEKREEGGGEEGRIVRREINLNKKTRSNINIVSQIQ